MVLTGVILRQRPHISALVQILVNERVQHTLRIYGRTTMGMESLDLGDEDIIKCGTVTGSTSGKKRDRLGICSSVDYGKKSFTDTEGFQAYHSWIVQDSKRGLSPQPLGQAYGININ